MQDLEFLKIITAGWENCNPGHTANYLRHYPLFHYILKGKGKFVKNGKEYNLKKGDGFIIFGGEMAFYQADMHEPWEYCWLEIGGTHRDELMQRCGFNADSSPIFSYTADDDVEKILKHSAMLFTKAESVNQLTLLGNMFLFLSRISSNENKKLFSYADSIKTYIHNNYSRDINVEKISRYMGLNRSYLSKIFKSDTGVSPQEYLLNYRLEKSLDFLKQTSLSITEIAACCGFNDATHFSNMFKKKYSYPPSKFKSKN